MLAQMIRHILLIKFNAAASLEQIHHVETLFAAIPSQIEGVDSVEWGANDSPERKNQGYTHSVLMTFTDEAGRQNYLPHPVHEALKVFFKPLVEAIVVFDYTV